MLWAQDAPDTFPAILVTVLLTEIFVARSSNQVKANCIIEDLARDGSCEVNEASMLIMEMTDTITLLGSQLMWLLHRDAVPISAKGARCLHYPGVGVLQAETNTSQIRLTCQMLSF